jgi:hemoglobin-like flavoprotein
MTEASLQRIAAHYNSVADSMPALAQSFYDRLFIVLPEARAMFKIDIALQSQHMAATLALIVRNMRFLDALEQPLKDFGAQHARVGVRPEHYPIVCRAMVDTLREGSGDKWSPELQTDWTGVLAMISRLMMEGAREKAAART